ncbi:alanine racemase [Alkanindiges sp. WGS2144]|uniref:alanine racemase n=1 Tax=Alkanindiges sp. WGS2144 TaxID=3366808 RepID=UPI00375036DB
MTSNPSCGRQPFIELSTSALSHNLNRVRQLAPHSQVISMVKADAYGHGIEFALNALQDSDAFGVACIQEARQIRALGYTQPVTLIEGAFSETEWLEASKQGFDCLIHQEQQVQWALAHPEAYQRNNLKIWLKLNSGMNRLGLKPDELLNAAYRLRQAGFKLVLTMHFANADVPDHLLNQQQIQAFLNLKEQLAPIEASCCNSAAIYNWPDLHFDYVRPGIMLYGASPYDFQSADQLGLRPVMHFKSHLMAIQQLEAGQSIGYGSRFITTQPTLLGIVAAGYGDGYPRALLEGAYTTVRGFKAPLLGRVSMDLLAIDLTGLTNNLTIGDEVTLWGENPTVDVIAHYNQTIGYELLCRLTQRPKRMIVA